MSNMIAIPRISTYFAELPDPRVERTKLHPLVSIVSIALCAVLCGADSWVEVAEFGAVRQEWFARWLELPHGIATHDTFGRVFAALDPVAFEGCFTRWVQTVAALVGVAGGSAVARPPHIVAVDGKVSRGSHDRAAGRAALDLVSAWASDARLVLGQVAVAAGSNEIPAIPVLLRALALEGCVVTIDAIGCHTTIAAVIQERGADYVLALKENQPALHHAAAAAFTELDADAAAFRHTHCRQVDKGHGRLEVRTTTVINDPALLAYLDPPGAWRGLAGVARGVAERTVDGQRSQEARYFLVSLATAKPVHRAIRSHWGIENGVHWVLDMAFREDLSRVRIGHGAHNFSLLRRLALNLLRQDPTARGGIKCRRLKAAWDPSYLLKLLNGSF